MRLLARRCIELWVETRDGAAAVNPVMKLLLRELAAAGAVVLIRVPERELIDPRQLPERPGPDLVLLKTATTFGLSLATADEAHGVRFLNSARATVQAHDKAAVVARLASAGLPVPETFLWAQDVQPVSVGGDGAWVAKPVRGVHGRGVVEHSAFPSAPVVPTVLDAAGSYVVDDGTRLIQRRIGSVEADLKVYVAGEAAFGGIKQFSKSSYATDDIEPVVLDATTEKTVRAVGDVLDLRCFGVDIRLDAGRPVIIDVNPFPGYRGFPTAVPALLREITRRLEVPFQ